MVQEEVVSSAFNETQAGGGSDGGFGGSGAGADSVSIALVVVLWWMGYAASNSSQQLTVDGYTEYVWYTSTAGQANNSSMVGPLSYVAAGVKTIEILR